MIDMRYYIEPTLFADMCRLQEENAPVVSACERVNPKLADGVGFEPTSRLRGCRFSRPVYSTALPPIRASEVPCRTASYSDSRRFRAGLAPVRKRRSTLLSA